MSKEVFYKRMLSVKSDEYDKYVDSAKKYIASAIATGTNQHLLEKRKPFYDVNDYITSMYSFLNIFKTMNIQPWGRILEVGSGPGWITEILLSLDYYVDALEPSDDFIKMAAERVESFRAHVGTRNPFPVEFFCETIESFNTSVQYDAILLFDVLHHVIDEEKAIRKCYDLLKKGGVLAIRDPAWVPGDAQMESLYRDEMEKYGTLENPFTIEYLDYLLTNQGFEFIERYYEINGLFPFPVRPIPVYMKENQSNIVTAIKPYGYKTTKEKSAVTKAEIKIVEADFDGNKLTIKLSMKNMGETVWLNNPSHKKGYVTVTLFKKETREELPRQFLSQVVCPQEELKADFTWFVPDGFNKTEWCIDLVNEGYYWFENKAEFGD